MKRLSCYVSGRFREAPESFEKTSPVDGEVVAIVSEADRGLVDEAVHSARKALSGPWGSFSIGDRAKLLEAMADAIEARFEDFLEAEIRDTGKPVALASRLDVPRGGPTFAPLRKWRRRRESRRTALSLPAAEPRSTTPGENPKES